MLLGGAMQPVNKERGLKAEAWRLREKLGDLRQRMNRAKQVSDESLYQSLLVEWIKTVVRMRKMGLPGVPKATGAMLDQSGYPAAEAAYGR
jgi:hypothetical protein